MREAGSQTGVTEEAILREMSKYDPDRVKKLIKDLMKEGKIMEPRNGVYKEA
jgi:DNA replicative helicase MCM subunit Mcm2 (Cdc46/Mcm family)